MDGDDQDILGAGTVDYFAPESGPGASATNFSATAQRERFLGGTGTPERKQPSATETSRSKLAQFSARTESTLAKLNIASFPLWSGLAAVTFANGEFRGAIGAGVMAVASAWTAREALRGRVGEENAAGPR